MISSKEAVLLGSTLNLVEIDLAIGPTITIATVLLAVAASAAAVRATIPISAVRLLFANPWIF